MALPLERLEGKYEILLKLSEGGMGTVYKVRHKLLDEVRVIKVMRPSIANDEVVRARFLREAQMAVRLRHPNLAQIFDFTVDDEGFAFIVMEFVDGFDLHQMVKTLGPPSVPLAVELVRQALSVLGYLHRRGVVHRDVSPDNLLLTRDEDGGPLVKLIDLGIAKLADGEDRLTAAGSFVGKVRYSSPEHFRGEDGAEIDPRSDLYSLGIVLYELLTGRYPIQGTTVPELMAGHLLQPPLAFKLTDPEDRISPLLREVVLRAIAKEPGERYGTATDLSDAISEAVGELQVDPLEVAALFSAPAEATIRLKVPRPGSTQNHLDRNFQLSRTPAPDADHTMQLAEGGPQPDGRPSKRGAPDVASQLRAFMVGAEKLLGTGHFDEARLQLQAALALDPTNPEVGRLLAVIDRHDRLDAFLEAAVEASRENRFDAAVEALEEALELDPERSDVRPRLDAARAAAAAEHERRRRADELAATLRTIEDQVAAGDLIGAERGLALARKVYGHDPALLGLPALLDEARAARRKREAGELAERARASLQREDFTAVLELVDQARRIDPSTPDLAALSSAATRGLQLLAELRRRQERARALAMRVERLIAVERLGAARLELEEALEELGELEVADELANRIDALQGDQEHRSRHADGLLEQARQSVREGRLDDAAATVAEIRALSGDMPDLLEAVVEIEAWAERRRENERRLAALRDAEASIEARLTARDLDRAERELQVAERLFGKSPSLALFRDRLEAARREERHRKVEALVRSALGGQAGFPDVIATLEQALAIDPTSDTVQRLLMETRGAHRRYQQERLTRSAATAMLEVDRLIADDQLEAALTRLDQAIEEVGAFAEAARLRPRLVRQITERS